MHKLDTEKQQKGRMHSPGIATTLLAMWRVYWVEKGPYNPGPAQSRDMGSADFTTKPRVLQIGFPFLLLSFMYLGPAALSFRERNSSSVWTVSHFRY